MRDVQRILGIISIQKKKKKEMQDQPKKKNLLHLFDDM